MNTENPYTLRFKDAPWMNTPINVVVVGLGGIGSHTAFVLSKTLNEKTIHLIDLDKVEPHNVGTQFYSPYDIGKPKTLALRNTILNYTNDLKTIMYTYPIPVQDADISFMTENAIVVMGLDNMKARKYVYEQIKINENKPLLLIDGRLDATSYEVFVVDPNSEFEMNVYGKSIVEDSNLEGGVCTMRQTFYFGTLIASRITNIVTNFLSKRALEVGGYKGISPFKVPFNIKEMGDNINLVMKTAEEYDEWIIKFKQ